MPPEARTDIDLLAGDEALRAILAIGKSLAGTGDVVDPGFQGRRDAEVDKAGGENDGVGRKQLIQHAVGNADDLGLALGAGFDGRIDAGRIVRIDMRQRLCHEIAYDQLGRGIGGKQFLGKFGGDVGRMRGGAARAGGDKKDGHGGSLRVG